MMYVANADDGSRYFVDRFGLMTYEAVSYTHLLWRDKITRGDFTPTLLRRAGRPADFTYCPITQYGAAVEQEVPLAADMR